MSPQADEMNDAARACFAYGFLIGLAAIIVAAFIMSSGGCQP